MERGLLRLWKVRGVVWAFLIFLSGPVLAADFSGRLVAVVAGDVVEVLHDGHREKIHLAEITCPKREKHWARAAKAFTANEALDQFVSVLDRGTTRGVRTGDVVLPGNRSLGRELVRQGLARWDGSSSGDSSLGTLETDARAARRGLWADPDSIQPDKGVREKRKRAK